MRVAPVIELTDEERRSLVKWSRGKTTPLRLVQRAKIVLVAAEGRMSKDISAALGVPERTISKRRNRFSVQRLAGIEKDAPRGGRTPSVLARTEAEIMRKSTPETPPAATQWSLNSMAKAVGVGRSTVQRVSENPGLSQPKRGATQRQPRVSGEIGPESCRGRGEAESRAGRDGDFETWGDARSGCQNWR